VSQLQKALQSSTAKWKVVFAHHPIFTKGRGHDVEARTLKEEYRFEEALIHGGADIYLAGHEVSESFQTNTMHKTLFWKTN
jgi:hypothetical protein